jgi:hypothetical protein
MATPCSVTQPEPRQACACRAALLAIGALLLAACWAWPRCACRAHGSASPTPEPWRSAALRFEDGADGSVAVIDAAAARPLEAITGEQGFLRGTLRALARERRKRPGLRTPPSNWCCAPTAA